MDILRRLIRSVSLIPVTPMAEPANFNNTVRNPGLAFLKTMPNPTRSQWNSSDYWRRALGDLINAYHGICAYCACWTFRANQTSRPVDATIDHFIPKSAIPIQAYEWGNFRLSRRRLNERKGNHQDVLDPFGLNKEWFRIDFLTFLIIPNPKLPVGNRAQVMATINRLELNADNDYVNERIGAIREYCTGKATLRQLEIRYPFIATEMKNQDFDTNYLTRMKNYFERTSISPK
jgi:hypothetical protein